MDPEQFRADRPVLVFAMPEGFLDGSDMDIAHRLLDGMQTDLAWQSERSSREGVIRTRLLQEVINRQRARLGAGDEDLANRLAERATQEAQELASGDRYVVTGQASLFEERARMVNNAKQHLEGTN